jgi:hypothetical protein
MSDFIQSFIARRREEEKKKSTRVCDSVTDSETPAKSMPDGIIRTYKDIVEHRPRKRIVHEFFRQKVLLLNEKE